jgi:hypothetical protein
MAAIICLALIIWLFWGVFFKEKRDLKNKQKETAAIIEKNNQELQKAKFKKRNRITELEQIILQQYAKAKSPFLFFDTLTFIPYKFDENIGEYLNLLDNQDINPELKKIILDYQNRKVKEAREREVLLKQKRIKEQAEKELQLKLEKERQLEKEKLESAERYKNMTLEELESEAQFWYEMQAEIRRGK